MRIAFLAVSGLATGLLLAGLSTPARATVYTDNTGTTDHWSDSWADIANVVVTNDLVNLTFTINLNPLMNDGTTPNNIQNNNFTRYDIGIQTGPGGYTGLTEPFGQSMGISSGQNFNIESWANQNAAPSTLGGYALNQWNGSAWVNVGNSSTDVVFPTGKTLSVPLATLGLSGGGSFFFDVWTTFGGANGAYDALDNPTLTSQPFNPGLIPYDSATASGSTFAQTVYTVVIPEPTSIAVLGLVGLGVLARRRI